MKIYSKFLISGCLLGLLFTTTGCKKDDEPAPAPASPVTPPPGYSVPTTYNFTSVDFSASTNRINMLAEILTYIRTTHVITAHGALDDQKLKDMYENANNQFTSGALNTSGIQLKDKTGNAFNLQADLEANFTDAALASVTAAADYANTTASNGVAGKLISGTRYILVDSAGFEYKEYVEKGIMGGVFYYQATTILNAISSFDNSTVTGGTTEQERAWDEAFGYFGVPIGYPSDTLGLKNWGSYCNAVSNALGGTPSVRTSIMNAWLKGRAAISNKDDAGRNAARDIVVRTWEKVGAARFITYVKGARANIGPGNQATFNHNLSEGIGFIRAFKYNSAKTISDSDLDILLGYFQTGGSVNLYTLTTTNLDSAIDKMAVLFGLDASLL